MSAGSHSGKGSAPGWQGWQGTGRVLNRRAWNVLLLMPIVSALSPSPRFTVLTASQRQNMMPCRATRAPLGPHAPDRSPGCMLPGDVHGRMRAGPRALHVALHAANSAAPAERRPAVCQQCCARSHRQTLHRVPYLLRPHLERPARVDVLLGQRVDELVPVQLLLHRLALRVGAAHALPRPAQAASAPATTCCHQQRMPMWVLVPDHASTPRSQYLPATFGKGKERGDGRAPDHASPLFADMHTCQGRAVSGAPAASMGSRAGRRAPCQTPPARAAWPAPPRRCCGCASTRCQSPGPGASSCRATGACPRSRSRARRAAA
jgi:hypothetical protein